MDIIERAYDYASRILVELMMGEAQLQARLSSMKSYFLMSQGDFFLTFMDLVSGWFGGLGVGGGGRMT